MGEPLLDLRALMGPPVESLSLSPGQTCTLGRGRRSDFRLEHRAVSRRHACLSFQNGQWVVADAGSRHGTVLNGTALRSGLPTPLASGDQLRILPWTFAVRIGPFLPPPSTSVSLPETDVARPVINESSMQRSSEGMRALLECTSGIHAAEDQPTLLEAMVDALLQIGFDRGAILLRTGPSEQELEVLRATPGWDPVEVNAALIGQATAGEISELVVRSNADRTTTGTTRPGARRALCAPIWLDDAIWGFLYSDSLGTSEQRGDSAAELVRSIAESGSAVLARIKRAELRDRLRNLDAELAVAAKAQRLLMPVDRGHTRGIRYATASLPRQGVGADVFDLLHLDEHRTALVLGEVSGRGAAASIVMAIVKSFLHGRLERSEDLATGVEALNRHLCERVEPEQSVSLWVGILDTAVRSVAYVDAGHGCAVVASPAGGAEWLAAERQGRVLGVKEGERYPVQTAPLPPGHRLVVFSGGLVEQPSPGGERFGPERVIRTVRASEGPEEDVRDLLEAVRRHAEDEHLADDLSIASLCISEGADHAAGE